MPGRMCDKKVLGAASVVARDIRRALLATAMAALLLAAGCVSSTLRTHVDPSMQASSIGSVAIFPMRNVRLLPDESRDINRSVSQAFQRQNPSVKIVGPAECIDLLAQGDLTNEYSRFLRNYAVSGIPNVTILKKIGEHLGTHALLQGEVFGIQQVDGEFGMYQGKTSLTVRYALLSTRNGNTLWEATSSCSKRTAITGLPAPSLHDVILLAQERILSALPRLGEQEQGD